MQGILDILKMAGGFRPTLYVKIENPPYIALVIEATPEPGPIGLPALSVAHYGEQNGDLMRDPEMCFELCLPIESTADNFAAVRCAKAWQKCRFDTSGERASAFNISVWDESATL